MANIVLGVTGGIAAYKSAELIRRLIQQGHEVRVIMTRHAEDFVRPLTFATLSQHPVVTDLTSDHADPMSHITLARWVEQIIIAPATANVIAKLANGIADDVLTTTCLASTAPIFIAPSMNLEMWQKPVTQDNIKKCQHYGIQILGPATGEQACGDIGLGRMLEPEDIVREWESNILDSRLRGNDTEQSCHKHGLHVVITAGPTYEAIDPVRFIGNKSSGKMGFALAKAFKASGAIVTLIVGPTQLMPPKVDHLITITTAEQMLDASLAHIQGCDIFIGTAAVADYRPVKVSTQKIKKSSRQYRIDCIQNPDIISTIAQQLPRPFVVGFAAETENFIPNAQRKLSQKNLDMIVVNPIAKEQPFGDDHNEAWLLTHDRSPIYFPTIDKQTLAQQLALIISNTWILKHEHPMETTSF